MNLEGIWFPPETQFMTWTQMRSRWLGDLQTDAGWERTRVMIQKQVCQRNDLPVDWPSLEQELAQAPRDYIALFDVLLAHLQQRQPGCRRLGEKSPNHLLYGDELLRGFPDAQMIHVIRDGRDVAVSNRDAFGSQPAWVLRAALRWNTYQAAHQRLAQDYGPDRYTSVRYEDLVRDPAAALRPLCMFLSEPFQDRMLQPHERSSTGFASRETHKLSTLQPVFTGSVQRFRASLSNWQIAQYEVIAGRFLRRYQYPLVARWRWLGWLAAAVLLPLAAVHWWFFQRRSAVGLCKQRMDNWMSRSRPVPTMRVCANGDSGRAIDAPSVRESPTDRERMFRG